jgi:hypothetical protein
MANAKCGHEHHREYRRHCWQALDPNEQPGDAGLWNDSGTIG